MTKEPRFMKEYSSTDMKEYSSTDMQKGKTIEMFKSAEEHPVIINRKARGNNPSGSFVLMQIERYDQLTMKKIK